MKNKKNKKKTLIIIALLLVAVVGATGYGAYSYYWTQGNFRSYDNSRDSDGGGGRITTNKRFDPQGLHEYNEEYDSEQMEFLGNGGKVKLNCSDEDDNGNVTCTGYSPVRNDGNVTIVASHSNFQLLSDGDSINISSITPTYKWVYEDNNGVQRESSSETFTLQENKSVTLVTTFQIHVGTGSTAQEVTAPVIGSTENLTMSIDLKATQYNSGY